MTFLGTNMVPLKSLVGLSLADLQNIKATCLKTLQGTLQVGQSYTIGERHYDLADLDKTTSLLAAANYAIRLAARQSSNRVFPNFAQRRFWRF